VKTEKLAPQSKLCVTQDTQRHYVCKPSKQKIAYLARYTPLDGETYYYTLLLKHVAARHNGVSITGIVHAVMLNAPGVAMPYTNLNISTQVGINGLLSANNVTHTYQEECLIRGIFTDDDSLAALVRSTAAGWDSWKIDAALASIIEEQPTAAMRTAMQMSAAEREDMVRVLRGDPPRDNVETVLRRQTGRQYVSAPADAAKLASMTASITADPDSDQARALPILLSDTPEARCCRLHGAAGTGKSHLLRTVAFTLAAQARSSHCPLP